MKYALIHGTRICQFAPDQASCFPVSPEMRWVQVADNTTERDTFVANAVVPAPTPAAPPPPTLDELYDQAIQNERMLKAVILALNDGSFPIGTNKTGAQLKAIVKAKM